MEVECLLETICKSYEVILNDNFVSLYVHGSLATNSFNWNKSDIDFIVVVKNEISLDNKKKLIKVLLDLDQEAPSKGFEMSVVLEEVCHNFIYPTPFCLHYSKQYKENYINDLENTCNFLNGVDKDLGVHFKMIKTIGRCIKGKRTEEVFGEIPDKFYLDSVMNDIQNSEKEIIDNPISVSLNLVRTLAYLKENKFLSKKEAGIWGCENMKEHSSFIQAIYDCYCGDEEYHVNDVIEVNEFAKNMLDNINEIMEERK